MAQAVEVEAEGQEPHHPFLVHQLHIQQVEQVEDTLKVVLDKVMEYLFRQTLVMVVVEQLPALVEIFLEETAALAS